MTSMFFKKNKSGVTKIVRDTYRKKVEFKNLSGQETWWSISKRVKERDNYCCVDCHKPENSVTKFFLHVHHILPLSRGGRTIISNLISLCERCHQRRHPSHSVKSTK